MPKLVVGVLLMAAESATTKERLCQNLPYVVVGSISCVLLHLLTEGWPG